METKAKHTPGPWIIDSGETDEYVIREPRGEAVAVICDSVLGEDDPNARLIAAAPELLEAAKYLQAALEAYSDFNCGIVTRKRKSDHAMEILAGRDSLSRAIAKAEGVK
ncbi:MAG: hypothetical protein M3P98_04250 [bacterium]|nr:hypothetical protein [bacterium]